MSYTFDSRLGEQLYQLMPEVYRTRDKTKGQADGDSGTEDLARYLDAHGHLLDLIHATLKQQLDDVVPESSQDWLLPYFAQLLAANIVSPDSEGRHAEITNAVSWRQRKGTLKCAEEIAEAIGQMEVEIQEGWKRVAMTPRIGMPIIPAQAWDSTLKNIDKETPPSAAAHHPALPAAMVDLRRPSRAVEALSTNPAARVSNFGGVKQTWRQANRHGVPCFPGSFDDVSRRTVDIRTPDTKNGHYHHKRLLAYAPSPTGFFSLDPIHLTWDERHDSLYEHLIEEKEENGVWLIRNKTDRIIEFTDKVTLSSDKPKPYRVEGLNFKVKLTVDNGGTLELHRVEAVEVQVDTPSTDKPVMTAENCLFNELSVGGGTASLNSCTILTNAYLSDIDAVDCIFMDMTGTSISGVVQYSRIPENAPLSADKSKMSIKSHHLNSESAYGYDPVVDSPAFISGQTSIAARAVLSPNAPKSIYEGASDHGEMGYYHRGRANRPVRISGRLSFSVPANGGYPLEGIVFEDDITVTAGQMVLTRSAAPALTVETPLNDSGEAIPSLAATDCLFDNIKVSLGLARLEYCTVMKNADCKYLQASDCIFIGNLTDGAGNEPESGCMRYSRIPEGFLGHALNVRTERTDTNTRAIPIFTGSAFCGDAIAIRDLAIDPNDSAIIYAGTHGGGVFKSEDGGLNWADMNLGLTDLDVQALAIDPNDPAIIYAGTNGGGVFRWDNNGGSWVEHNNGLTGPYGHYVQALAVDPDNSAIIYAGSNGNGVFKSEDGGLNWADVNIGLTDLDIQALAVDRDNSAIIYAGTSGCGVFKSEDGGLIWAEIHTGLTDLDIYALAIDPNDSAIIYAGTHGAGVFKSEDGGLNWADVNTGLTDTAIQALAIDPDDSAIIYSGTYGGGVFKSGDSGLNWADMNTGLTDLNVQALAVGPNDSAIIYAGTHGGGVFSSDDGGLNWAQKWATIRRKISVRRNARFGEPGYGVLDPVTPDAIRFGAEDGGEMGACHHKYYSLKAEAVLDKMREFLPVGMEPVLIQDPRLLHVPPEQIISEESTGNGGGS